MRSVTSTVVSPFAGDRLTRCLVCTRSFGSNVVIVTGFLVTAKSVRMFCDDHGVGEPVHVVALFEVVAEMGATALFARECPTTIVSAQIEHVPEFECFRQIGIEDLALVLDGCVGKGIAQRLDNQPALRSYPRRRGRRRPCPSSPPASAPNVGRVLAFRPRQESAAISSRAGCSGSDGRGGKSRS